MADTEGKGLGNPLLLPQLKYNVPCNNKVSVLYTFSLYLKGHYVPTDESTYTLTSVMESVCVVLHSAYIAAITVCANTQTNAQLQSTFSLPCYLVCKVNSC